MVLSPSRFSMLSYRFSFLCVLAFIFFFINVVTRLALQYFFPDVLPFSPAAAAQLFYGLINDFFTVLFALVLPVLLLFLPGDKFLKSIVGKCYSWCILFLFSLIFVFTAFAEYFFWEEFACRFNFIAIDYLIYTTEVIQNIIESYPLFWLFVVVFAFALILSFIGWQGLRKKLETAVCGTRFLGRFVQVLCFYLIVAVSYYGFSPLNHSENRYWNEYAKNGVYSLFSAYLHNQLNYRRFYETIDTELAFKLVRDDLNITPHTSPVPQNTVRKIIGREEGKNLNVVIVIIESLGSRKYKEHRPFLNALAEKSLHFSNMKSTGTRTVRGLEAIMLSIPPTPGNSIVRRSDNADLYSLATPFKDRDYDLNFIYGDIGFFDNMNSFFEGIGFQIVDQLSYKNDSFSNAWGQCDGDSYAESLLLADTSYARGKNFLHVVLTTSNHRPFTFPENELNLPQGIRTSAVRYTDYAIEKFMDEARQKPWFEDTVFVFVGDHPSSIAGKTEVPYEEYGVVSMMYSPKYITPKNISLLCSQIDIAPTLLDVVGFEYMSPFFGKDILKMDEKSARAFVSTYQLLGYEDENYFMVLDPSKKYTFTAKNPQNNDTESRSAFINKAIAYYQTAYDVYKDKMYKEENVKAVMP